MSRIRKILSLPSRHLNYWREWEAYRKAADSTKDHRFPLRWDDRIPALWERTANTAFDAHYVYHPAWALRVVKELNPKKHIDISSSLHFCAALSAIIPVEFYDYRPAELTLTGLTSGRADLMRLPFGDATVESLSCMHTIEHIGLGRYGDPIDPSGDLKAAAELTRVVRPGGHLVMVTPVGKTRICFNAHRIYSRAQVLEMFCGFELVKTALVRDDKSFVEGPDDSEFDAQTYGCGCFLLRKLEGA